MTAMSSRSVKFTATWVFDDAPEDVDLRNFADEMLGDLREYLDEARDIQVDCQMMPRDQQSQPSTTGLLRQGHGETSIFPQGHPLAKSE